MGVNKWFAVAAGVVAAFIFFWKRFQSPSLVFKPVETAAKQEPVDFKLRPPEAADPRTAKIQSEARRSVQIIFMGSLLQALQERIDTIAFESEYTFKGSLENGVDVKTEAITDHIRKYLVENMDAEDWPLISGTTGFVPRSIPNDGFSGFEYRVMKVKQIDRLNFMAKRFKKLIDDYGQRPL
jgi:hypothetical protein